MSILRVLRPRKCLARRLLKYVVVCVTVSLVLFATCHDILKATWRPLVLKVSSAQRQRAGFTDRGHESEGQSLSLSRRLKRSQFYKPEWIESVNHGPKPADYKRNKWEIIFITDSNASQEVVSLQRKQKIDEEKTKFRDGVGKGSLASSNSVTHRLRYSSEKINFDVRSQTGNRFKVVERRDSKDFPWPLKQRTILLWTTFFGNKDWLPQEKLLNCNISNWPYSRQVPPCRVTSDKSDLLQSDLVIMHANDLESTNDLPRKRLPNQRWLFYCMESPKHMYLNLTNFSNVFNYTALNRRDSDYVCRHGGIIPKIKPMKKKKYIKNLEKIMTTKQRLIAARISNCGPKERLEYIRELQKYIQVDFYGACGEKKCPKTEEECNGSRMVMYKFYLAFENSNCRDYITEKFWLPLHHWNSVPVVMGGLQPEDYEAVAPPHSYINVADFSSPKKLAEYLTLLDKNQTMYQEFFKWRQFYNNRQRDDTWCRMCADLHNSSKPIQYYADLKSWYEKDACIR